MQCFSFTLRVEGVDTSNDRYEDAFYEAGCGDALLLVVDGALLLDFDREASNYDTAVRSATKDVEKAGGRVVGVDESRARYA